MCNNKQQILWWVKLDYGVSCGRIQLTRVIGKRNYDFFCQHIFTHKNITAKISNGHFYSRPTLTVNIFSRMKQTSNKVDMYVSTHPLGDFIWAMSSLKLAHNVLQLWKYVVRLHPLNSANGDLGPNEVSTGWLLEGWMLLLRESWMLLLRESWMLLLREG